MSDKDATSFVSGKLILIPTTLGDIAPLEVLPYSIKKAIETVDHYIVENEKSARRFIKRMNPNKTQGDLVVNTLNKFTDLAELPTYLNPCEAGHDVGLISEAGCPAIADPGADVVRLAHEKNIQVVPLVGPSSLLLAMMASGLNGQNFAFNGYLPIESSERRSAIKRLERISKEQGQTQLFIETPYRNDKLTAELLKVLRAETLLCIAVDITLPTEYIVTKTVADWRQTKLDLHKRPAIFIIQA